MDKNLEIEGRIKGRPLDLNSSLRDSGVSSLDFVAIAKLFAREFNVTISTVECANIHSLGELVNYLDAKAAYYSQPGQET